MPQRREFFNSHESCISDAPMDALQDSLPQLGERKVKKDEGASACGQMIEVPGRITVVLSLLTLLYRVLVSRRGSHINHSLISPPPPVAMAAASAPPHRSWLLWLAALDLLAVVTSALVSSSSSLLQLRELSDSRLE